MCKQYSRPSCIHILSMAPWCPACRAFQDAWSEFAGWGKDLDISVGVVDVTQNPGKLRLQELCMSKHLKGPMEERSKSHF